MDDTKGSRRKVGGCGGQWISFSQSRLLLAPGASPWPYARIHQPMVSWAFASVWRHLLETRVLLQRPLFAVRASDTLVAVDLDMRGLWLHVTESPLTIFWRVYKCRHTEYICAVPARVPPAFCLPDQLPTVLDEQVKPLYVAEVSCTVIPVWHRVSSSRSDLNTSGL